MEDRPSDVPLEDSMDLQLLQDIEEDYSMPLSVPASTTTPTTSTLRRRNHQDDNNTNITNTTTPTSPGAPNTAASMQSSLFTERVAKSSRQVCIQRSIFLAVLIAVSIFATVFIHESTANREEALFQRILGHPIGRQFFDQFRSPSSNKFLHFFVPHIRC